MPTHVCGQCNQQFSSEEEYINHECAATGFTPKDPDHLGPEFKAVSEAALKRGAARTQVQTPEPTTHNPQPIPPDPPLVRPLSEESLVSAVKQAKRTRKPNDADEDLE